TEFVHKFQESGTKEILYKKKPISKIETMAMIHKDNLDAFDEILDYINDLNKHANIVPLLDTL
ncbi:MAG: hypothetical protein AABY09_03525, partial [Nanoarchaeota archaeon]